MNSRTRSSISQLGQGYQLHQDQRFNLPVDEIFEFFADPKNLEKITPSRLRFEVQNCDPLPVQQGTEIEYELRIRGFPIKWVSRITDYVEGEYFIDKMLEGPYKTWEHIHTFETVDTATLVGDQVYYELPYGWVGEVAHTLFVKGDLEHIFNYRAEKLREIFG